jgi:hypothetical protein
VWIAKIKRHLSRMVRIMDKYEDILKNLIKKDLSDTVADTSNCITDEAFSLYLENLLDEREKEDIEEHLIVCKACRQKNIALHKFKKEIQKEDLLTAPTRATEKAKQLVKEPVTHNLVEVVLEFARDTVRIIKNTGSIFQPIEADFNMVPVLARESVKKRVRKYISHEQKHVVMPVEGEAWVEAAYFVNEFDGLLVAVTIERVTESECEMKIRTEDSSGVPIDGIRLNLILGEKELASYLTREGYAIFKNLPFNEYSLVIARNQETIGTINLTLEGVQ